MPKKSSSNEEGDVVSESHLHSSQSLTRRAIHSENKLNEERNEEEEENEIENNENSKELDSEELVEDQIQQQSSCVSSFFSYDFKKLIYVCICIGVFVFVFIFQSSQKDLTTKTSLSQILEDVESHFKHQPSLTHRYLKKQLNKVFNVIHEPTAPAIITIIANRGAESTASDFCLYLGKALAPEKYILINESSYWDGDPDDIKFKIDKEVKSKYNQDQMNVIIIDKLQKIPFKAAMIFHSYCDHENSPFKKAVFLFILPVDKIIPESASMKDLDSFAMDSLRHIWISATDDDVDSLITRIAGAVVNIK